MAKITKKPNTTVSGLGAPVIGEGNRTMTASWSVPAAMTKSSNKARATNLITNWVLNIGGVNYTLTNTVAASATSSSINLNSFSLSGVSYNRNSFYPKTNNRLSSVSISVAGKNAKGTGAAATQTRAFAVPPMPTVDEITFNSNGICSTTVRVGEGTEYQELYDTRYRVTVVNTKTGTTITSSDGASTSEEFSLTYDASDYQSLDPEKGQYIHVKVEAWSRGYAGDSGVATRNIYVSYPAQATIENIDVSAKDSTGKLTAKIKTNRTTEHPVDTVTIQYLADVTYENASDIPANASWEDSEIEDNGDCTALAMPVDDLIPSRGKHTWIRVKSVHLYENLLFRYSAYSEVKALYTPPASAVAADVFILSATPASGDSAVVKLGWNASGSDEFTGTELSWSEDEDTWRSTESPDTHEFTWSDGRYPATGTIQYHDSAEIIIKGLKEGTKYYIKARRYLEGDTTTYGNYSSTATVVTSERPAAVVASCNRYVAAGEPLSVYWTFSGNALQTEWQIVDSNGTIVANGEGSIGATQISADRLAALAVSNSITFNVQVSTGSGFVPSESHTVRILQKPTLSITAPATLTAQPFSFTATSSRACDLIVIVTSQGASGQFPQGFRTQTSGDTIHSDVYVPIWSNGSATITLPSGLDFWDLGNYTLSVVAEDRETKLRSPKVVKDFTVAWSHKAVDPDEFITLTSIDTVADEEEHLQGVQIALTPPTGSSSSDVYDIYRMDGDNAHLIGSGFPRTYTVIDEYAPFGDDVYYRIALRTADGDVEFAQKEYVLESDTIRFDWSGGSLELPYGLSMGENYRKDVEFRQHMDGSTDGYWNANIERKGSYNSAVIKLIQPEEINLARALARYPGAVFVRTANGSAYSADVQVTDLSVKNEAVTMIAVDATEVSLTEEFMLPSPYEV